VAAGRGDAANAAGGGTGGVGGANICSLSPETPAGTAEP
jgi:hypothetical protein